MWWKNILILGSFCCLKLRLFPFHSKSTTNPTISWQIHSLQRKHKDNSLGIDEVDRLHGDTIDWPLATTYSPVQWVICVTMTGSIQRKSGRKLPLFFSCLWVCCQVWRLEATLYPRLRSNKVLGAISYKDDTLQWMFGVFEVMSAVSTGTCPRLLHKPPSLPRRIHQWSSISTSMSCFVSILLLVFDEKT